MINSLKNIAEKLLRQFSDPKTSSRVFFSGMLIVGIIAMTLDFGPRVAPQYFKSRLLDPIDTKEWNETKTNYKDLQDGKKRVDAINKCIEGRNNGEGDNPDDAEYKKFLERFEESFSGILPGAGNLLLAHPAVVNDRREKLVFEVMKHYAEKKFCIPQSQFELIYLAGYKNSLPKLDFFFQARLNETDDTKYKIEAEKTNPVYYPVVAQEYSLVEKDLVSTQKYVEDVIDRSIKSVIEFDKQTQLKLANVIQSGTNQLINLSNQELKRSNEFLGNINLTTASTSSLTKSVTDILAIETSTTWDADGYLRLAAKYLGIVDGAVKIDPIKYPEAKDNPKKIDAESEWMETSFGILNLVTEWDRMWFLQGEIGAETVMYVGALLRVNPFVPGQEIELKKVISEVQLEVLEEFKDTPEHICGSVDETEEETTKRLEKKEGDCFEEN